MLGMPSWPSGKMSAVVPSCCPWSRATTGCPSSSLTWNRGGSGEAWKSPAAGASACRIRTGTARCDSAAAGAQGRGGAAGAIFSSSLSWVVVRIARSIGLRGNAETGANCAGAVSGPAGGDSPRRWLAAEREADVKAPSITPRCPGAEPRSGCRLIAQGSGDTRDPGRASGPYGTAGKPGGGRSRHG